MLWATVFFPAFFPACFPAQDSIAFLFTPALLVRPTCALGFENTPPPLFLVRSEVGVGLVVARIFPFYPVAVPLVVLFFFVTPVVALSCAWGLREI